MLTRSHVHVYVQAVDVMFNLEIVKAAAMQLAWAFKTVCLSWDMHGGTHKVCVGGQHLFIINRGGG